MSNVDSVYGDLGHGFKATFATCLIGRCGPNMQDFNGRPTTPKVFFTNGAQGVNIHENTWHGVLTPLFTECDFLVIDRVGPTPNVEESVLIQKTIIKPIPKKDLITP